MNSIAFHLGPIPIYWYGILVATGFILGISTAARRARTVGESPDAVMDLSIWLLVGGVIGARFLYVISYWDQSFAGQPISEIFKIRNGGMVFYGGFIGGILGLLLYTRWKKLKVLQMADILAPSLPLGHAFGRVGCLMTGCCYGKESSAPWAVRFPEGHPTFPSNVHPTQIYSSLLNIILFAILVYFFHKRRFQGQILGFYLVGYAITRTIVEAFRGDYPYHYFGLLTQGQLISLGIVAAGVALLVFSGRREPQTPTAESADRGG